MKQKELTEKRSTKMLPTFAGAILCDGKKSLIHHNEDPDEWDKLLVSMSLLIYRTVRDTSLVVESIKLAAFIHLL